MIALRQEHQSGTSTHSERIVQLDPKFALSRVEKPDVPMSIREASHILRVAQELAGSPTKRLKSAREQRWQEVARKVQGVVKEQDLPNLSSKNVTAIHPLRPGSYVIMKNKKRTYLGEVLDIYKKMNHRHGSLDVATSAVGLSYLSLRVYLPLSTSGVQSEGSTEAASPDEDEDDYDYHDTDAASLAPPFSCRSYHADIHAHAPAEQLLYHLGANAASGPPQSLVLKPFAAIRWSALTKKKVQEKLYIRLPARIVDTASAATSIEAFAADP
ncbi:hypothetical protein NUW54_g14085 [Trametes sanguinea]|uniref:Uncharacterized protein n=1 Tax=Trametes sanguinea TaxID=158606 RepID=A0ACC1MH08_9APHY|nr:hypothetical protein NUW54_g14085 [Trametes sanguinea]